MASLSLSCPINPTFFDPFNESLLSSWILFCSNIINKFYSLSEDPHTLKATKSKVIIPFEIQYQRILYPTIAPPFLQQICLDRKVLFYFFFVTFHTHTRMEIKRHKTLPYSAKKKNLHSDGVDLTCIWYVERAISNKMKEKKQIFSHHNALWSIKQKSEL